ncbi:ABC transporter ATP-binding protein [Halocatena pleomorpha]|uniref:Nickel import system ATP-binding protein NikD n=1 Tax=Halocatena pleomorpha TaxID=1785090 RepID=A0A3P3RDN5_9EURY|nr:ABC transporter ATP-binding protein [Halocatena pleomorpha]RRJ31576.1 ABC transporter ATP-binding protein [Halocatena pleomorpha]
MANEATNVSLNRNRSTNEPIITVRDTNVRFEMDSGSSHVLKDVALDIYRGETLGVVGESGSGKSMFADSLLNAVVEPGSVSGEITYYPENGEPIGLLELQPWELREVRWELISMVFQGAMSAFNPTMNIREHFEETLDAHGWEKGEGLERAERLFTDLHLDPERMLTSFPHELSGGQKQRALIALSLILEPEVLVMDEPTAALDLLMQRSILNLLYDMRDKYGLTIVFISHDLPIVSGFADRLAVMYAFEFAEVGRANDILGNASHPYTRALLKSTPNLATPLEEMRQIDGESPDPVDHPEGCSYHPRCPVADERCEMDDPGLYRVDGEHEVRCHYWEAAAKAVPLSFGGKE